MKNITIVALLKEWPIALGVFLASFIAAAARPGTELAVIFLIIAIFVAGVFHGVRINYYLKTTSLDSCFTILHGVAFTLPLLIQAVVLTPLAWIGHIPFGLVWTMIWLGAVGALSVLSFGMTIGLMASESIKSSFKK